MVGFVEGLFRVFGCPAYAYVNDGKLEPKAKKCIFLGYTDGVRGYRLWDPSTSRIINRRDVTFNESVFLRKEETSSYEITEKEVEDDVTNEKDEDVLDDDGGVVETPQRDGDVPSTSSPRKATTPGKEPSPSLAQRRIRRSIKPLIDLVLRRWLLML